jgi:hypothetical protein
LLLLWLPLLRVAAAVAAAADDAVLLLRVAAAVAAAADDVALPHPIGFNIETKSEHHDCGQGLRHMQVLHGQAWLAPGFNIERNTNTTKTTRTQEHDGAGL